MSRGVLFLTSPGGVGGFKPHTPREVKTKTALAARAGGLADVTDSPAAPITVRAARRRGGPDPECQLRDLSVCRSGCRNLDTNQDRQLREVAVLAALAALPKIAE